jgi:hypothetical protein
LKIEAAKIEERDADYDPGDLTLLLPSEASTATAAAAAAATAGTSVSVCNRTVQLHLNMLPPYYRVM